MRRLILILATMACLGLTGCGSKMMQPVSPNEMNDSVSSEETGIVFFRSTKILGRAISYPIIEAGEDDKLSFVAIIPAGTKYLHKTTPGKHRFFVGSIAGSRYEMLEADMEAGKTYYADVAPSMAYVYFTPVPDVTDKSFRKDLAGCDWVQNTPEGEQWFLNNLPSLQTKYGMAKTVDRKIILPEYGAVTPVR